MFMDEAVPKHVITLLAYNSTTLVSSLVRGKTI